MNIHQSLWGTLHRLFVRFLCVYITIITITIAITIIEKYMYVCIYYRNFNRYFLFLLLVSLVLLNCQREHILKIIDIFFTL
jgi:hypothetical protein